MSDFGKFLEKEGNIVAFKRLYAEWEIDAEFLTIYKLSTVSKKRKGEKKVKLEDITSYRLHTPSSWNLVGYGFIEINYPGSKDLSGKGFKPGYDEHENVLPFVSVKQETEEACKFYNEFSRRIKESKNLRRKSESDISFTNELHKLAELKKDGMITEDEFNTAKLKIIDFNSNFSSSKTATSNSKAREPKITALLRSNFKSQGIQIKTQIKDRLLNILLESKDIPDKVIAMKFIQSFLVDQGTDEFHKVKVYGRKIGDSKPVWRDEFDIPAKVFVDKSLTSHTQIIDKPFKKSSNSTLPNLKSFKKEQSFRLSSTSSTFETNPFVAVFALIFFSVFALVIWRTITSGLNLDSNSMTTARNEQVITASEFGDKWPLSVQSGRLRCLPPSAVFFETDSGETYAVNGAAIAMAQSQNKNLPDIEDIWLVKPDPKLAALGIRKTMILIQEGQKLCN